MELTVGQALHGFTVTRVRQVEELNGKLVEMKHDKTGAELCWMDNGEETNPRPRPKAHHPPQVWD